MKLMRWMVACLIICATAVASDAPKGTVPRAAPEKYDAHAEQNGVGIGATLLTSSQARKAFATDVDRCCLVVEVALYPQKDGLTEVSLNDFALRIVGQDIATKPSSAEVVAGKLQRRTEPQQPGGRDVIISPTAGIGYETGSIDPITGQRRPGGVTTGGGVGVGVGSRQPTPASPASNDADRRTMELELSEKGLPQGNTATPVSGYVYFSLSQKKSAKYQLEYLLNGNKVVLALH